MYINTMRSNASSTSSVTTAATQNVVKWRTRLTTLHEEMMQQQNKNSNHTASIRPWRSIPIVSAPMAGHAGGKLAAAVCHAGGIGMIGGGHWLSDAMNEDRNHAQTSNGNQIKKSGLDLLHDEISIFREYNHTLAPHTKFPLCIGLIGHSTFASSNSNGESIDGGGWERLEYVLQTYQPSMIQFFAPAISYRTLRTSQSHANDVERRESNIQLVHRWTDHNTKVFVQVGTVAEAIEAMENNADGIMVQGSEAGGHGVRRELGSGTLSLVANVIHRIRGGSAIHSNDLLSSPHKIPILAAGGIVDGPTMAAVMALGCDGVVIGTRFWASSESIGLPTFKDKLVTTQSCDDVARTTTFDWIQNTYSQTPWPKPYDSVGAIKNETYYQWEYRSNELASALQSNDNEIAAPYRRACLDGNTNVALVHAGEGIGQIHSIKSAHDLVHTISNDAMAVIQNLSRSILQTTSNDYTNVK
jgi:nitronate monooxygenase